MASTYKSPGAYIEEITKFPPSVAAVETAIPAFIGYTEKAEKNGETLFKVPTKIDSFLEFEQYFGGPPSREIIIRLNTSNQFIKTERKGDKKPYLLYDSLRLFYDNGGGICYIVSVGDYTMPPEIGNNVKGILAGLRAMEKYDEPTLILSPDAVSIDSGLYTFQQQALAQCNKLQDRFLICDLLKSDEQKAGETLDERVGQFRDNIGINYLKYGAAYVPWLKTSLPLDLLFRDVTFAYESDPAPTSASSLNLLLSITNNPAIQQLLYDLDNSRKVVDDLKSKLVPGGPLVNTGIKDLRDQIKNLQGTFMGAYNTLPPIATLALLGPTLRPIYEKVRDVVLTAKTISDALPTIVASLPVPSNTQTVEFKLAKDITTLKEQGRAFFNAMATHHKEIVQKEATLLLINPAGAITDLVGFLVYPGPGLPDVPIDTPTRQQYRLISAKKAAFDQLLVNANNGTTNAANTNAAVLASVPLATTVTIFKAAIDAEITGAAAATPAAASAALGAKIALPATANDVRITAAIAKSIIDEETALNPTPITVGALIPDPAGFTTAIISPIFPELVRLRQAAAQAAAVTIPPATKANVTDAVTVVISVPREFALLAANGAVTVAASAIAFYESIMSTAQTYESTFNQSLLQSFGIYKTLVTKAGQDMMILPPSAGVAGVYASVDSNRGVWKAPANASLSSVLGPFVVLNVQDQEGLNVDPNAGKSINAIRYFTGKGTLVWGTRTLAGNDNEWRYVPVRRFFNYAEESIKKATEPFVFEPNDLNTWVRVKAMIENFLTLEWRRGALAGSKPDSAFYVKVGLGETMTAFDILEGKMIIEVGMAVVRPAEFIILRFAHKMQEV
jgi:phage tail sheath protein FI